MVFDTKYLLTVVRKFTETVVLNCNTSLQDSTEFDSLIEVLKMSNFIFLILPDSYQQLLFFITQYSPYSFYFWHILHLLFSKKP